MIAKAAATDPVSKSTLSITSWVLVGSGLAVFLVALLAMIRALWRREASSSKKASQGAIISLVLKCMLPWTPFLRVVDIFVSTLRSGYFVLLGEAWSHQTWVEMVLSSLPGYVLVATYLLLVLFWAWLFKQTTQVHEVSSDASSFYRTVVALWLVLFAAEMGIWLVLIMLMAALPSHFSLIHQVEAVYASVLSISVALLFAVWGLVLFRRVKAAPTRSDRSRLLANKIFVLTVVCTILFLARTIIIMVSTFDTLQPLAEFVLTIIWTFGCEFLPTLLIIIILHWSLSSSNDNTVADKRETKPINSSTPLY